MNDQNTIPCYPWAVPTEEQKRMFDSLSHEEQLNMLRNALIEGEKSGDAGILDMDEIRQKAKAEMMTKSLKK